MVNANQTQAGTLLISRSDVQKFLSIEECIDAVESAFRMYAEGKASRPGVLAVHVAEGGFHTKAGSMQLGRNYFVAKTNANFPGNPKRSGLPTIQGIVMVSDADDGRLLALIDSIEITILRTGAATGVAARHLSKRKSRTMTVCGCGNQGRVSVNAVLAVRGIDKVFAYDIDESMRKSFAIDMQMQTGISVEPISDLSAATRQSDIIITCTTSTKPFLTSAHVRPGTFIAAVGADSEHKHEVDPALFSGGRIVTDLTDQSATIGDLHHALACGILRREDVYAELGDIVSGKMEGRRNDEDIIVFDSTGMALQDVAAAAIVYEKAVAGGFDRKMNFGI